MYRFDGASFYPYVLRDDYESAGTWPNSGIDVDEDCYNTYAGSPTPDGKRLGVTSDGQPCWVDTPPPSHDELVAQADARKTQLQREAEEVIKPLERSKQLGMTTAEELKRLEAWERYSVLLMRVDTSTAPNIKWPASPTV